MRLFAIFFAVQALLILALVAMYVQPILHVAHTLSGTPTP